MAENKVTKSTKQTLEQNETPVVEETHTQEDYQEVHLQMQSQIQELQAKNESLLLEVETLKAENKSHKSHIEQLEKIAYTVDVAESEAEEENFVMKCEKKHITALKIDGQWYGSEIASVRKKPLKDMAQEELQALLDLGTVFKKLDSNGNFIEEEESEND